MKYLSGAEEQDAKHWMEEAAVAARKALCHNTRCGAVIVKDRTLVGDGYNAPPRDDTKNPVYLAEKTMSKDMHDSCVHAEWRAIFTALQKGARVIIGSRLYFVRVDEKGNIKKSGKPYCTHCSRAALDVGIREFVLWHEEGIAVYPTDEYNTLSYQGQKE